MIDRDELSGGADAHEPENQGHDLPESGQDRDRDERGRFAGRQPSEGGEARSGSQGQQQDRPQGQAEPQPEAPEGGQQDGAERQQMVPHQALHAAREEAKRHQERYGALESRYNDQAQQVAQLIGMLQQGSPGQQPQQRQAPQAPPQPPPDWYESPQDALAFHMGQHLDPLQQRVDQRFQQTDQTLNVVGRAVARAIHGENALAEADAGMRQFVRANPQALPALEARILQSGEIPQLALIDWWREHQRSSDDYIETEIQRRLAAMGQPPQPQQAAPSQPAARPQPGQMPSNFAGGRSAAPRGGAPSSGPRSLSEIMGR